MLVLVLLTSTIVLTFMPGWRSYLMGLSIAAGLLAWACWPVPVELNYDTALHDYMVAMAAPFCWLAFVIAMVGKIAWLSGIMLVSPLDRHPSAGEPAA
jgi:hypothetical protein